jgi:hypothetical protein
MEDKDLTRRETCAAKLGAHMEAAGYGLLAAGIALVWFAYLGAYIRSGLAGFTDIVNPFVYCSAVLPGVLLIWVGRKMAGS